MFKNRKGKKNRKINRILINFLFDIIKWYTIKNKQWIKGLIKYITNK